MLLGFNVHPCTILCRRSYSFGCQCTAFACGVVQLYVDVAKLREDTSRRYATAEAQSDQEHDLSVKGVKALRHGACQARIMYTDSFLNHMCGLKQSGHVLP